MAGRVAKVVEHLHSKCEALSLIHSIAFQKRTKLYYMKVRTTNKGKLKNNTTTPPFLNFT
jgi:hypothetical protein